MKEDALSFQVRILPVNPRTCIEMAMKTAVSKAAVKINPVTTQDFISKIAEQSFISPASVILSSLAIGGKSWESVVNHRIPKMTVTFVEFR